MMPESLQSSLQHVVISEEELNELPLSTYVCELCGLSVKTKANLRAHHIKTHRIFKGDADIAFFRKQKKQISSIYHCPIVSCKHSIGCGGGFSSCSRLKQHYQIVHMLKAYECTKCAQRFPTPSARDYHERLCGSIYRCPDCSRSYSYKKHLFQHFRRSGHSSSRQILHTHSPTADSSSSSTCPISSSKPHLILPPAPPTSINVVSLSSSSNTSQLIPSSTWLPLLIIPFPAQFRVNETERLNSDQLLSNSPSKTDSLSTSTTSLQNTTTSVIDISCQNWFSGGQVNSNQCDFVSQGCGTSPLVENYTQTEGTRLSIDDDVPSAFSHASVNIGTDDGDISAFIGSLFCDASVETTFPSPNLVNEFTDTSLDVNDNFLSLESSGQNSSMLPPLTVNGNQHPVIANPPVKLGLDPSQSCYPVHFCSSELPDQSVQTSFLPSLENICTQTEAVTTINVAAFTNNDTCTLASNLKSIAQENTPPLKTQKIRQLSTFSDTFYAVPRCGESQPVGDVRGTAIDRQSFTSRSTFPTQSYVPFDCIAQPANDGSYQSLLGFQAADSSTYYPNGEAETEITGANGLPDSNLPSFQSVGLQSSVWSSTSAPCCSTMETQTLDEDIESWLNSVHTQTSSSPFTLTSFSNLCDDIEDALDHERITSQSDLTYHSP